MSMDLLILERWLSLLRDVRERGKIHGQKIVLNTRQSHHLASICFSKLQDLIQQGNAFASEHSHFLRAVNLILQEIESYFESCSETKWLRYVITDLDSQEANVVHLYDFLCCMATLDAALHQLKGFSFNDMIMDKMEECDQASRSQDLSELVLKDRDDMIKLLLSKKRVTVGCLPCFSRTEVCPIADFLARKCAGCTLTVAEETLPKDFRIQSKDLSQCNEKDIIGQGTSGVVFEGRWLGEIVAIKQFPTKHPTFTKEAAMLACLRSPYIVQLIGWSVDEKHDYLVMERMSSALDDYMASRRTLECVIYIMLQISRGMEYLHKMKVMHRDLKPSNVLVKSSSRNEGLVRVKLSDFGMAKFKPDSALYSTEKQGTTYYRAPEVLAVPGIIAEHGGGEHDHVFKKYNMKADVFSFAILSYELLANEAPKCFLNASAKELYIRVTNNVRPELPTSCPPVLVDLIKSCWDTKPDCRPPFADISRVLRYVKSILLGLQSFSLAQSTLSLTALLGGIPQDVDCLLPKVLECEAD